MQKVLEQELEIATLKRTIENVESQRLLKMKFQVIRLKKWKLNHHKL